MKNKKFRKKTECMVLVLLLFCISISHLVAEPCGSVNSDGLIDIVDALLIAQYYVGIIPGDFDQAAADVNADGAIDIVDALLVAQYYVGLITELPGCNQTPEPTSIPTPTPVTGDGFVPVTLNNVRILSGPFKTAQDTNLNYLLSMDPERLLAPFRIQAGINTSASNYPNWESDGLDGHIGGHYLSACALMYASTGNSEMLSRLNYMIDALEEVQNSYGNGYLAGIPDVGNNWNDIASGNISAAAFDLNGMWVPWYNIHKTFAGLRDAYIYAGNQKARTLMINLSDWTLGIISNLSDSQVQTMLACEHGGMNEVLADTYTLTNDSKYLNAAKRFSHTEILDPLLSGIDELTGMHANTQIPKVAGYERIGSLDNNQSWVDAADFFWDIVVNDRSISIGGNSVSEHFQSSFSSMVTSVEGPETCNTHNMLRLTKALYQHNGSLHYMDYYERALYNHILSSQHPSHGGFVYFTAMRPDHYRVYSTYDQCMWCCVGSGMENPGKYGEMIYVANDNEFFINLFVHSTVDWKDGISFTQDTNFPDAEDSSITVNGSGSFGLNIRYPGWVSSGAMTLSINGQSQNISEGPGQYIRLYRAWNNGDVVSFNVPMHTRSMQLTGTDYYSILHGPIVLGAERNPFSGENIDYTADSDRWAHIADGQQADIDAAPAFSGTISDFVNNIVPGSGDLTFSTGNAVLNTGQLTLIPFFRIHDTRYTVYFRQQ